jgi:hypothetical protein
MYLARTVKQNTAAYSIRQSYPADGFLQSREIFKLGPNPAEFIKYPGGNAYYFDERLVDALDNLGVADADNCLDDLLWEFLKPEIRRNLDHFNRRACPHRPAKVQSVPAADYLFDKRRLLFLKSGRLDQGAIGRLPRKLFKDLDHKSRDEIEQYFLAAERILKPAEFKIYTYVIFDLQKHFASPLAKNFPAAMGGDKLDSHFVDAVCRLDADRNFWRGLPVRKGFNAYLARYVAMYFDNDFPQEDFGAAYARDFRRRHRGFRFPTRPAPAMSLKKAARALGLSAGELKQMPPAALTRHYRKMAIKLHPDQGGDHDTFIRITEAYQAALKKLQNR